MNLDIALQPLIPLPLTGLLAACILGLAVLHQLRGLSGAGYRVLAAGALALALCNPVLTQRETKKLNDIAFLVIDDSPSQKLGQRARQTRILAGELRARLEKLQNVDLKVITVNGEDGETRLFQSLARAMGKQPPERISGAILVTDGQIHDIPRKAEQMGINAPLHAVITGGVDEKDRRLVVENAPRFGLIGKTVTVDVRIEDSGHDKPLPAALAEITMRVNGEVVFARKLFTNRTHKLPLTIAHRGENVIEISVQPLAGELTSINNRAVISSAGIRDRLRVLLVSGAPHAGKRTWRQLLKSDPMVDLVHFTILRPPEKLDGTPISELSLIAFPTRQLFVEKLHDFDLIIFDRYHRQNVLPLAYLENVADYVRQGGAVLVAAGPAFATPFSLYRTPLAHILPAIPTGNTIERPFRPALTELGKRHPVTRNLPGGAGPEPEWGRWFRFVEADSKAGHVVMSAKDGKPLLILSNVDQGRVALLLSDHAWLWTRGFEGGGPQAELLRRLAHWLMKEPDLEEEALSASIRGKRLTIKRRSLKLDLPPVSISGPDGAQQQAQLNQINPGLWQAGIDISQDGLYRIRHGKFTAIAASGAVDQREFKNVRSSGAPLTPLISQTGGVIITAAAAAKAPAIRMVKPGRPFGGADWVGLRRNGAEKLLGEKRLPLITGLMAILLLLGAVIFTWRRESQ